VPVSELMGVANLKTVESFPEQSAERVVQFPWLQTPRPFAQGDVEGLNLQSDVQHCGLMPGSHCSPVSTLPFPQRLCAEEVESIASIESVDAIIMSIRKIILRGCLLKCLPLEFFNPIGNQEFRPACDDIKRSKDYLLKYSVYYIIDSKSASSVFDNFKKLLI
jgi:hypothetical protein